MRLTKKQRAQVVELLRCAADTRYHVIPTARLCGASELVEQIALDVNYDLRRWTDSPITSVEIYKGEAQRLRDERDQLKRDLAEACAIADELDNYGLWDYDSKIAVRGRCMDRIAELRKRAGL